MSQTGIHARHSRRCRANDGGTCNCKPSYRAGIHDRRTGKRITKTFSSLAEAKNWRADASGALRKGTLRPSTAATLREESEAFLTGIGDGTINGRGGASFKPSVVRSYASGLRLHVLPELGNERMSNITLLDVQDLVDRWVGEGHDAASIRSRLVPLRTIYRRALRRGLVSVNPTVGLELPAPTGHRDRVVTQGEFATLLGALEAWPSACGDVPLWKTAAQAGLRRGELAGARWQDVDIAQGVIRVSRSWDVKEGPIETKSRSGRRTVPILFPDLSRALAEHKLASGRNGSDLVFGRTATEAFTPSVIRRRAHTAWREANAKEELRAEEEGREPQLLVPIGLHECRHTFASTLIAAGVNAKAISVYMGHSSIQITFDRYGHLMPGNDQEAEKLVAAYLETAGAER